MLSSALMPADLRRLLLWLLEREAPPLLLLCTTDPGWWTGLRGHRLLPLLYVRLQDAGLMGDLPPAVVQFLNQDYRAAVQLCLLQEAAARRVLQAAAVAGIEVILLKGADLRLRLYKDPAARPMADLDFLVAPESLRAMRDLLGSLGYTLSRDSINPQPGFRERYRVGLHFKAASLALLLVDLHWELEAVAGYYRLPWARLAPQARTLDWQGMPVKVLSPEHALMHLCLHNYDEGEQALNLVDLGLALTCLPLNWPLFLAEAARCCGQAPILLALRRVEDLLPGALPPQVLRELGAYVPRGVERLVLRHSLHPLARLLGPLSHQPRPWAWAAYMAALLWPDPAYLIAVNHSPSRLAYLASSLKYLLSRGR